MKTRQKKEHYSGLRPTKGWPARNYKFFFHRVFPQLIKEPVGESREALLTPPPKGSVRVTWIGHASFYIQFHDRDLLIDPVWGEWLGFFRRKRRPGLSLASMPEVDTVLVSHAHADHLHRHTLRQIQSRHGIVVAKGSGSLVQKLGFSRIQEMTVWDTIDVNGIEIQHTPSLHWGARFGLDTFRDYGGYLISYDGITLYHAGDTAYFEKFTEIKERAKTAIDIAILPIGAYEAPSGRNVHMTPEEAVQSFQDLGAHVMLPMHHDTFPLGNEADGEASQKLLAEAKRVGLSAHIQAPDCGEEFLYSPPHA